MHHAAPDHPSDHERHRSSSSRREAIRLIATGVGVAAVGLGGVPSLAQETPAADPKGPAALPISLAQWSLHRAIFAGELKPLDFPKVTREVYGLGGCEFVNAFYRDAIDDDATFAELRRRAEGSGVRNLLIMIDGEGDLGDPDPAKRRDAVARHLRWATRCKEIGGSMIRVNAGSKGTREEQAVLVAEGLSQLAAQCEPLGLSVIVENHGGFSSDGEWLAGVMRKVNRPNCGTLPDFGNFRINSDLVYDRYDGVRLLMPFAKAVSAKSYDFDGQGDETTIDYARMLRIIREAGYRGWIGIEYEGNRLSEKDGILATRRLLERLGCVAAAPVPV